MGKIFYLMGKSSCGKDTIYKQLLADEALGLSSIVMYTTRPVREGETNGVEYIFSSEEELANLEKEGKVIEIRAYNTVYGIWRYFTVHDEQIDLEHGNYLIIGTLESFLKTKKHFGGDVMFPLYIEVDDGIRLERALQREKAQKDPKYEEMCRRFLADQQDFSAERLKEAGIKKRFYNGQLTDCVQEIRNYINNVVN